MEKKSKNSRELCASVLSLLIFLGSYYPSYCQEGGIVTGTVTDGTTGELLPGVNILVKGSTVGSVTDIQGSYSIATPSKNGTLIFSFIGYATKEISIDSQTNIDV